MPREIHPSRRTLPYADWPLGDRLSWEKAIVQGDVLDGRGPAAHWSGATKRTNVQHYGRWLGYLRWRGKLDAVASPASRVTPDAVRAYNRHLERIVAPYTRLAMLVGLKVTMQAVAREGDWRWLQDACNHVQRSARPIREKRPRIVPTQEIYKAALNELRSLPQAPLPLEDAIRYRDAFMLALLALRPLRVKNFTALAFERHLRLVGDQWLIVISGEEAKNHRPIEYYVPNDLIPWFERYRREVRPVFPRAAQSDRLWLNYRGPELGQHFLYLRIAQISERLLGRRLNPHLLRDCAASSMATESVELARAAAPLLGHTHFATTERYYLQANTLAASRRLNAMFASIRRTSKGD